MRKPYKGNVCEGCKWCSEYDEDMNTCKAFGSRRAGTNNVVYVDRDDWAHFNGDSSYAKVPSNVDVPKLCFDDFAKDCFVEEDNGSYVDASKYQY